MNKIICWNEPSDDFKQNIVREITVAEAIKHSKLAAQQRNYTYINDGDALEDFMTIHWAWFKKEEK